VIDPKERDPVAFDREHVILLSDHSTLRARLRLRSGSEAGYCGLRVSRLG
jgi:hypothetical protein